MNCCFRYKKKILIITDVTKEGGTNTYIYNLLKVVTKIKKYDFSILLDDNKHLDLMEKKCGLLGIEVIKKRIYHGTNTEKNIRETIVKTLQDITPDLVHVFCGSIRSALCIRETVIDFNLPLFSTETYVARDYPITYEELIRVRRIYNNTVLVTTVCNANIDVLRNEYGIYNENVLCIPTSCDMKKDCFQKRKIENNIQAVVIARLTKQKGIDILIEAFRLLDIQYRNRYQIDIVGDGEIKNELVGMIEKYDLNDYFHFLGWKENVFDEIGKYNLGIIPSRDEGLPNVEIEMLKSGLPLLVSDVKGVLEAANDGQYVEVFNNGSELELRDGLIKVLKNPEVIISKSEKAYRFVKKHYDMDINYKKFIDLWES